MIIPRHIENLMNYISIYITGLNNGKLRERKINSMNSNEEKKKLIEIHRIHLTNFTHKNSSTDYIHL